MPDIQAYQSIPRYAPVIHAVVVFLLRTIEGREEILLPLITRGYLKGYLCGVGGKQKLRNELPLNRRSHCVDGRETPIDCALRETWEELRIKLYKPTMRKIAVIHHKKPRPDKTFEVVVFTATDWQYDPTRTDEADPTNAWFRLLDLPYDRLVPDLRLWMPEWIRSGEPQNVDLISSERGLESTILSPLST